jgi:hypothetical protein
LFALGHETPYSVVVIRAPGSGGVAIVWTAQLVPFQRSARLLPESIAVHAAAAEQATRDSAGPVGPPAACIAQTLPFQTSASACCMPELSTYEPTAIHEPAERHDTPARELLIAPAGTGTGLITHVPPIQSAASDEVEPGPAL